MRHRNLTDTHSISLMALDDILDRGSLSDSHELVRMLQHDPLGPVSDKILHLCRSHAMYGTSSLWPAIVERLRRASP